MLAATRGRGGRAGRRLSEGGGRLNLPRFDGRAVLQALKADENLRSIPVVIFTTSSREEDVSGTYELHANAFITKPVDFDDFSNVVQRINDFFTRVARLPRPPEAA